MLVPGLVSITFRELPPNRIVALCVESGLRSIEWGGDIHVPHGDLGAARRIRHLTLDAGLEISAYGSYYRAAGSESQGLLFDTVCRTAVELGAPIIRVWAGNVGSPEADGAAWRAVTGDLQLACDRAGADDIGISLEFHGGTLADTAESTNKLIADVGRPNLSAYWQPPNGFERQECVRGLKVMLNHVENIHAFHWWPDHEHRLPLENGADRWHEYLSIVAKAATRRHVSLEFVRNGDIEQFRKDAITLKTLLDEAQ